MSDHFVLEGLNGKVFVFRSYLPKYVSTSPGDNVDLYPAMSLRYDEGSVVVVFASEAEMDAAVEGMSAWLEQVCDDE